MKALLIWTIISFGQGKYAGEPFYFAAGAYGTGMGSAMTPISKGVSSLMWNPSGLARMDGKQVMLDHASSFSGMVSVNSIMGGMKKGAWGFAAGLYMVSSAGLTRTSYDTTSGTVIPVGEFDYNFSTVYFGAAKGGFGIAIKAVHENIDTITAIGIGLDIGVQKEIGGVRVGAVVHDLSSTPIIWSTGKKEAVLPNARLGIAYSYRWLTSVAEAEIRFENIRAASTFNIGIMSVDPHIGVEARIEKKVINDGDHFSVRAGLDRTIPAFGAGFSTKWATIDYAFLSHTALGGSHRITITVNF